MGLRDIFSIRKSKQSLENLSRGELHARTATKNRNMAISGTVFLLTGVIATKDFNNAVQWTLAGASILSGLNCLREAWNAHSLMNRSARLRNRDWSTALRRPNREL